MAALLLLALVVLAGYGGYRYFMLFATHPAHKDKIC